MDGFTLKIDPATRDISFDEDGIMETVAGAAAAAQNVRLTLEVWRGEFPFDPSHGTDYERIMGKKPRDLEDDEIPEVIREAIFQEPDVEEIEKVDYAIKSRGLDVSFTGRLSSGTTITTEVNMK